MLTEVSFVVIFDIQILQFDTKSGQICLLEFDCSTGYYRLIEIVVSVYLHILLYVEMKRCGYFLEYRNSKESLL